LNKIKALRVIDEIVPARVLIALAKGLEIGLQKHTTWESDQDLDYYENHLRIHLRNMRLGQVFDNDDGHTNGSAVIIRAMQLVDQQLKRLEGGCVPATDHFGAVLEKRSQAGILGMVKPIR
jgi:hypothetical protein